MNKKMRLLLLTQLPPPVHGVTVISSQLLSSIQLKSNFEIDVIPMQFSRSVKDIDRLSFGKIIKTLKIAIILIYKCVITRPDLIYFTLTPTGNSFIRDLLYVFIIKLFRIKPMYHLHGVGVNNYASTRFRRSLYKWVFTKSWIILLSKRLFPDIEKFVLSSNCYFLPNGIPDPVAGSVSSRKDGPINIIFLSHMVILKGPIVLMRALAKLKNDGVDFNATFAGGRFMDDCKQQFEQLLNRHNLANQVKYLGEVYGEEKNALLREADVLVFPSLYDAFPLVILEAMANKLPVISTDQGAIPDMVEDGVTGYIVQKNDSDAVANRLKLLAEDPVLRVNMGAAARDRFCSHFTSEVFEKNMIRIFKECADKTPQ